MDYAGIDVSKDWLDLFAHGVGYRRFEHSPEGIEALVALMEREELQAALVEASGGLELKLLDCLYVAGHTVYRLNPRAVRSFADSIGRLEKTDRVDAEAICLFGATASQIYPPYQPQTADVRRLQMLWTRRRQLVEIRADEKRRRRQADDSMASSFEHFIEVLDAHIAELEEQMTTLLATEELNMAAKRLESVPGIGKMTVIALLAYLPELGELSSKKIAKLVGVAPLADESGRRDGPRRTRGGRKQIRDTLYMAALTAIRFNPFIASFAQRLSAKGKHPKVIRIACANKLIRLLNAMAREEIMWQQTSAAAA